MNLEDVKTTEKVIERFRFAIKAVLEKHAEKATPKDFDTIFKDIEAYERTLYRLREYMKRVEKKNG